MKRGLRRRLVLSHLVVALVAIAVVALVAALVAPGLFDRYRESGQAERRAALVSALADTYCAPDGWDASAVYALGRVARMAGLDAAVYSLQGQLLFTVQGGATTSAGGAASPAASPATRLSRDEFTVTSARVRVDGREVATAEIYGRRQERDAAADTFIADLTRDVLVGAAAAALLALALGAVLSLRLTAPLEELSDAAGDVARGDLEARVAPRSDDEVGRLAAAFNEMADRVARDQQLRRDMAIDLSQELQEPLAAIGRHVEALGSSGTPPTPERLEAVREELARLDGLLTSLTTLNELESGDLELSAGPVRLDELALEAVAAVRPRAEARGVELATGESGPVTAAADADRLRQVLAALLDNALKFTPPGGRVTLSAAPGPHHVSLTVADTGAGIDPVDLPFVFDRFYRSSAARGTAGVGLGLALARDIVEAQGGCLSAADAADGGAVFTLELPAAV